MSKSSWRRVFLVLGAALLLGAGSFAATAGSGIDVYSGGIDMHGNDIVDDGTRIWDSTNGYIPKAQMQTGNLFWSDLGIAKTDVSASNVGLGSVQNEAQVSENGDSMSGDLAMNGNCISWTSCRGTGNTKINLVNSATDIQILAQSQIEFRADSDQTSGGIYNCWISSSDGSWNCDGAKNWVHSINSTHDAYYTSQESPQVRAVYEGEAHVVDSKKIELPSHFSKTVSDKKPILRAQVTPQGTVATVGVLEKTDDYIQIGVSKETDVNYRITGIREGYDDKQVVRKKE